ncbi:unnamed protein product [Staurois parvus]|uniref:Uncharacterized protein n=1 Tax=Staurois parvus TaxID=386267 RepID=A0ABN9AS02_9NEOB|nr:unnamed protein product [Staurois parvus]
MDTDRWHCCGYTDHQGTLIISVLMITVRTEMLITGISLFTCDQLWTQLIT